MVGQNISNCYSYNNLTNASGSGCFTLQYDWVIPVAINIILTVITLWMLISLVHYGIKTGKWKPKQATNSDNLNAGLVYTSVIICGVTCLVRYNISMLYMNIGFGNGFHKLCDSTADAAVLSYALVLFSVYLFLWFRQRVFYTTYIVRSAFSRIFAFFSTASIGIIFVAGVGAAVLNIMPINHKSSQDGCIYVPDESQRMCYWISVAVAVCLGQAVLLGLFVYPLQRIFNLCRPSYRTLSCLTILKSDPLKAQPFKTTLNTITEETSTAPQRGNSVIKLSVSFRRTTINLVSSILRRTLIFAIFSLSIDIFSLVFSNYIVQTHGHRRFPSMIYDVNSFLNLLLVVLSFVQYKEMMTSPCRLRATNKIACNPRH